MLFITSLRSVDRFVYFYVLRRGVLTPDPLIASVPRRPTAGFSSGGRLHSMPSHQFCRLAVEVVEPQQKSKPSIHCTASYYTAHVWLRCRNENELRHSTSVPRASSGARFPLRICGTISHQQCPTSSLLLWFADRRMTCVL